MAKGRSHHLAFQKVTAASQRVQSSASKCLKLSQSVSTWFERLKVLDLWIQCQPNPPTHLKSHNFTSLSLLLPKDFKTQDEFDVHWTVQLSQHWQQRREVCSLCCSSKTTIVGEQQGLCQAPPITFYGDFAFANVFCRLFGCTRPG